MIRKIIIKMNDKSDIDVYSKDKFSAYESMCLAATFVINAAKIEGVEIDEMQKIMSDYLKIIYAGLKQ